jgi:hypothetical protein
MTGSLTLSQASWGESGLGDEIDLAPLLHILEDMIMIIEISAEHMP